MLDLSRWERHISNILNIFPHQQNEVNLEKMEGNNNNKEEEKENEEDEEIEEEVKKFHHRGRNKYRTKIKLMKVDMDKEEEDNNNIIIREEDVLLLKTKKKKKKKKVRFGDEEKIDKDFKGMVLVDFEKMKRKFAMKWPFGLTPFFPLSQIQHDPKTIKFLFDQVSVKFMMDQPISNVEYLLQNKILHISRLEKKVTSMMMNDKVGENEKVGIGGYKKMNKRREEILKTMENLRTGLPYKPVPNFVYSSEIKNFFEFMNLRDFYYPIVISSMEELKQVLKFSKYSRYPLRFILSVPYEKRKRRSSLGRGKDANDSKFVEDIDDWPTGFESILRNSKSLGSILKLMEDNQLVGLSLRYDSGDDEESKSIIYSPLSRKKSRKNVLRIADFKKTMKGIRKFFKNLNSFGRLKDFCMVLFDEHMSVSLLNEKKNFLRGNNVFRKSYIKRRRTKVRQNKKEIENAVREVSEEFKGIKFCGVADLRFLDDCYCFLTKIVKKKKNIVLYHRRSKSVEDKKIRRRRLKERRRSMDADVVNVEYTINAGVCDVFNDNFLGRRRSLDMKVVPFDVSTKRRKKLSAIRGNTSDVCDVIVKSVFIPELNVNDW